MLRKLDVISRPRACCVYSSITPSNPLQPSLSLSLSLSYRPVSQQRVVVSSWFFLMELFQKTPSAVAYLYFPHKTRTGLISAVAKPAAIVRVKHVPDMLGAEPSRTEPAITTCCSLFLRLFLLVIDEDSFCFCLFLSFFFFAGYLTNEILTEARDASFYIVIARCFSSFRTCSEDGNFPDSSGPGR